MNERIKALEKQCWNHQTNHLDTEKFAELIVRECCDIVHRKTDESIRVVMAIEQHFGVEE